MGIPAGWRLLVANNLPALSHVSFCFRFRLGTGVCETENKPDTAACNDGKFCTLNDICVGGLCTGTPKLCPTPKDLASQCKEGVCSEASQGQCQLLPKPDGSTCNVPGTGSCSVDTCK